MEKLRKFKTKLLSVTLAAVMSLFAVGGSAFAAGISDKWSVDHSPSKLEDWLGWNGNGSSKFSVDDKVHTDNRWYSIKLENTDYNDSFVERTYNVEPYTTYKFSAMVKYSGYQLNPDHKGKESGACIGMPYYYDSVGNGFVNPVGESFRSDFTNSSDWTLLEYEFTTGNETTCNLALLNGKANRSCKGTAWFSEIKLEKAEKTNSWDILVVFFKNMDATVSLGGKTVHHKSTISDALIDEINECLIDTLPSNLKNQSNNKMTVNSIDRYYTDEVLTEKDLIVHNYLDEAKTTPTSYMINYENCPTVSKVVDKYLAQKHYNQIVLVLPANGIAGLNGSVWAGLGGTKYKGIHTAQINSMVEGIHRDDKEYIGSLSVHEITHGLEADSRAINPDKTPTSHMSEYIEQRNLGNVKGWDNMSFYEWYNRYMNALLPNGEGLEPSVFYRTNGKYILVSDDMTTGTGIEPGSSSVAPPAPKSLVVKAVEDEKVEVTWGTVPKASGYQLGLFKAADFKETWKTFDYNSDTTTTYLLPITKSVPYYYGIRTMASVNGTTVYSDWTTLAYAHNGVEITVPAPENLVVKAVEDEKVSVTWNAVPKASGYQLGLFKAADFKETWKTFDYNSDTTTTYLLPITKGVPYYYGIRTMASVNGTTFYSDWTTLAYAHEGVKVIRGDVDYSGTVDSNDVVMVLKKYLMGVKIDDSTAEALGISGRYYLNRSDVIQVIKWYLIG